MSHTRQTVGVTAQGIPLTRAPSERSAIEPFYVMEVMRAAAQREAAGHEVLHLEVGQPSTAAPQVVLEAASNALATNQLGYTEALGLPELRQAISDWYASEYKIDVPVEQIIATTGASGSCVLAFLTLWDPGARVGVLEPGYPCYRNDLQTFGIEAVPITVGPESNYRPTREQLDAVGHLDGLIIASPSNPTGTVLRHMDLQMLLDWANETGAALVVDEIYHGITYEDPAVSILELLDPRTKTGQTGESSDSQATVLVFNSFSKLFSMTGWRLGWIVAPPSLLTPLERLAQNLTIAPPTLSQVAGIAAFEGIEECRANVDRYRINRDLLVAGLRQAGITELAPPDGGFYIWCDIAHLLNSDTPDSQALCAAWLEEIGVAATPGIDFDPQRGHRFVRFSYAGEPHEMTEAMKRIASWIQSDGGRQDERS